MDKMDRKTNVRMLESIVEVDGTHKVVHATLYRTYIITNGSYRRLYLYDVSDFILDFSVRSVATRRRYPFTFILIPFYSLLQQSLYIHRDITIK